MPTSRFLFPLQVFLVGIFFLTLFIGSRAQADAPGVPIRFAAVVQYVKGQVERLDGTPIEFKTALYENEQLKVGKGGLLKLITKAGCTSVYFGEALVATPGADKPWRVKASALRWICPEGQTETVRIGPAQLELRSGELFTRGSRALVLRGQVSVIRGGGVGATPLPVFRLLRHWQPEPEASGFAVWQFNTSKDAPKESLKLVKPDLPISSRWIFTPVVGRAGIAYDQSSLNQSSLHVNGARVQLHRRLGEAGAVLALSFLGLKDPSKQSASGQSPPTGVSTEFDSFSIEAGYRFHFDRWWSPFFRLGLSSDKATIQVQRPDLGFYKRTEYEFYSVTAAAGVDAFYSPRFLNWLGVYMAAELDARQNFSRGYAKNFGSSFTSGPAPDEAADPWRLTILSAQVMFGLLLQF